MTGTSLVGSSALDAVTALLDLAERKRVTGDYRAGSELARQAAALAGSAGDEALRGRALWCLAKQLLRLGSLEEAATTCRAAVAALEESGDEAAVCQVLTEQSLPLNELGMHEEALAVLARGRQIAQRLGRRDLLYWVHNRTGVVHGSMGHHDLSMAYLMRALTMVDGMDAEARFCILNNVGDSAIRHVAKLRAEGDPEGAEQALTAALGHVEGALLLAREAGNPFRESIVLDNYGMLVALAGDFERAARLIEDARVLAVRHGYQSLETSALQHRAQVRLLGGDPRVAIDGLQVALARCEEIGEKPTAMEIHEVLSGAYEMVGDLAAALAHYRAFHALEREAHNNAAAVRARMAVHGFELDNARLEAENARLEAELHRVRSAELEADNLSWQRRATEDALTGLPNRRYVDQRLPELAAAGGALCVAVADVDRFKGVNDRFGHFVGDEVLRRIAGLLRDDVREHDLLARFGGEEFLIVLSDAGPDDAAARCESVRARVAAYPWGQVHPGLSVTISLGLAAMPPGGDLAAALNLADQRLYAAKRAGRNRVEAG
jgi:diguanylate cyclase (GGDEF)-like protein